MRLIVEIKPLVMRPQWAQSAFSIGPARERRPRRTHAMERVYKSHATKLSALLRGAFGVFGISGGALAPPNGSLAPWVHAVLNDKTKQVRVKNHIRAILWKTARHTNSGICRGFLGDTGETCGRFRPDEIAALSP